MIALFVIIYSLLAWLFFSKLKLVSVNKWSMLVSALIGVVFIGLIVICMNLYQPASARAQFFFDTTPIVPDVRGRVTEVPVQANEPLNQGDVLFQIDPTQFQNKVDSAAASLAQARSAATAADRELARDIELLKRKTIAFRQVDLQRDKALAAQESVAQWEATLAQAKLNLERTTVKAPSKGFVTQLRLRPGMMAVPLPFAPLMVFVHSEEKKFVAAVAQNAMQNIAIDDPVEIAFRSIPGSVFQGRVSHILPTLDQGQLRPDGTLLQSATSFQVGRVLFQIDITSDLSGYKLPPGASAQVAIYTGKSKPTAIIRKVVIRMQAWKNYLFFP